MYNNNYESMLAGRLHSSADPYLYGHKAAASAAKARLGAISNDGSAARIEAAKDLFANGSDPAIVLLQFNIQFGRNNKLGVALANKLARIAWSVLNSGKNFDWKEKE